MGWSLATPAHHVNPDGSVLVVAQLSDDDTGNVGTLQLEVDVDGSTRAFVSGNASLAALGMWDLQ